MSLVSSLDRVTQVVMDGLVCYPLHFVEKNYPEHARKNCKVLRVVHREGEFFTIPMVFALEGSQGGGGGKPGFFLGGGALVSCSASYILHYILFFFAEYQLY